MKMLTPEQRRALFMGKWKETGGDFDACLEFIEEVGRLSAAGRRREARAVRMFMERNKASVWELTDWIVDAVATWHSITRDEIRKSNRFGAARARGAAMWLLKKWRPELSTNEIAIALHRKDHTTVMYWIQKVDAMIATRPELKDELLAIIERRPALKAVA